MATRDDSLAKARLPAGTKSKGPLQSQRGAPVPAATEVVVIGFLALVACLVALGFLAEGVRDQEAFALDAVANPFLHTFASPALDMFMWAATTAGSNYVLPPLFVVAMVWLIAIKRRREAAFLAIASIGSLALNATMKVIFERPRPVLPWAQALPDFSFPSGHTMNSLVVYVALAIVLWAIYGRRVGLIALVVAIVLTVFIGISRIYLGFHYFTDVAAGALAGTGWLLVVGAAFQTGPFWRLWRDHGPTGSETR